MSDLASTTLDPVCHGDGYRHEALLYAGPDEFMAGTLPFLRDAVAAGEPTLVVLAAPKLAALREALNGDAEHVRFADMAEVGTNPARIIPAWQQFVAEHAGQGRRCAASASRSGRSAARRSWPSASATRRCSTCLQRSRLLAPCPYDTTALSAAVIEEARRNHRFVSAGGVEEVERELPRHRGAGRAVRRAAPRSARRRRAPSVDREALRRIRRFVDGHGAGLGLSGAKLSDLVLTVNELATNTVRHGGGEGTLSLWRAGDAVVCEVRDRGRIEDPLAGRVAPPMTALSAVAACGWPTSSASSCSSARSPTAAPSASTSACDKSPATHPWVAGADVRPARPDPLRRPARARSSSTT